MNGTELRSVWDRFLRHFPSQNPLNSVPFGSGVSNFKIPVLRDLGATPGRLAIPSQPIRKVLSAAWKLIRLPHEILEKSHLPHLLRMTEQAYKKDWAFHMKLSEAKLVGLVSELQERVRGRFLTELASLSRTDS